MKVKVLHFIALMCWILLPQFVEAQVRTIVGSVVSSAGEPLQGVTVATQEGSQQTVTDANGNFKLDLATNVTILVFSSVGYETIEKNIAGLSEIKVAMELAEEQLDQVVVVGYGSQSKRTLTTSVSKVSGKTFENNPLNNAAEGLKGKIAGVRVFSGNNQPGAPATITVRGGSSINRSNDPLVLVDGFVRTFDDINPNDIESIEVLKDAASTAIYGSRASNGVVLITTKKGGSKGANITFDMSTAHHSTERNYSYLNADDYIKYGRLALSTSNFASYLNSTGNSLSGFNDDESIYTTRFLQPGESVPAGYKSTQDPLDPSKTLVFQDNSFKDVVFQPSWYQNYFVGINGGNDIVRFAGSVGYTQDNGVAIGTGWKRFSAMGNTDIKVSSRLKLNIGFNFSESHTKEYPNQYQVISRGMSAPPTQRIYWDDGIPTRGYNATSPNPVWYEYTRVNKNWTNRYAANAMLTYNILKGLDFKVTGSYFNSVPQRDYFEKAHDFSSSRTAISTFSYNTNLQSEAYLSFNRNYGEHSISAVSGVSYLKLKNKILNAEAMGSNTDNVTTLNGSPTKNNASTELSDEVLQGYFGRVSYGYLGRYMLSGTYRVDGSSKFTEQNRWGFFPGVSAGWIISEESFFQNIHAVDLLKLRASYGKTGNNAIGLYDAFGGYNVDYRYNSNAGIRSTTMPNSNLRWETTNQFDIGFDVELFNGRFTVAADYFNKVTQDLIFSKPLPNTSGYSSVLSNIGKVQFRGFDFHITSLNISKPDFSWNTSLTFSFIKNKVLSLPENGRDKNRIGGITMPDGSDYGGIAEGEPLYRFYGYKTNGVIQTDADAAAAMYDDLAGGYNYVDGTVIKGRKFAGDYEWQDRNGDGRITSLDQFELGVTVPHTTGGLNNEFRYKRFTFNIYLDWALGHSIYDENYQRQFMLTFEGNWALSSEVAKAWTKPGDQTEFARLQAGATANTSRNYARASDNFTFKGDYLAIREVKLMYELPTSITKKIGSNGISVYVAGNNLHYFTQSIGVSPEIGASTTYATGYFSYPPTRKVALGLKIKL